MSKIHTMTDSVKDVALWTVGITFVGAAAFWLLEGVNPFEALYWSIISGSSTGYGDLTPKTAGGRIITMLYIVLMIWVVSPVLQGRITAYMTVNNDVFDDKEQEQIKQDLRETRLQVAEIYSLLKKDAELP